MSVTVIFPYILRISRQLNHISEFEHSTVNHDLQNKMAGQAEKEKGKKGPNSY
jgi:hypothetical protein